MSFRTHTPGVLCVGSALPDPPFELNEGTTAAGFDVGLMQAICAHLALQWRLVRYDGDDFNGIFDGLANGAWDCVASGTTITPERSLKAAFCTPYAGSGQSLVCDLAKTPHVRSIDDLQGMIVGVQHGNTSEPVAMRLRAEGKVAEVRIYAYHDIEPMLDDLEAGKIGAVIKLAPVMHWFLKTRPSLRVVQEGITREKLGIAVGLDNDGLREAIDAAQDWLRTNGALQQLCIPEPTDARMSRPSTYRLELSRRRSTSISRRRPRGLLSIGTLPHMNNTSSPCRGRSSSPRGTASRSS